jgi:hypothetical protein
LVKGEEQSDVVFFLLAFLMFFGERYNFDP